MIDEISLKRLQELHKSLSTDQIEYANEFFEIVPLLLDTLSAALKVVKAAQECNRKHWQCAPGVKTIELCSLIETLAPFENTQSGLRND